MKDATVSARIEFDVKTEAEDILRGLGIPVAVAIDTFYRQIIFQRGLPFSLTLPTLPQTMDSMTDDELDAKLQRSYEQSLAGEGRPFQEVFRDLKRGLE